MTATTSTQEVTQPGWIPVDNFGARLALIRQYMKWNYAQAARACGINEETWRQWEKRGHTPRGVYDVAGTIADACGCSYDWLVSGGNLSRSRWTALNSLRLIPGGFQDHPSGPGQMIPMALPLFTRSADN